MTACIRCSHRFHLDDLRCLDCGFEPPNIDGWLSFAPELTQSEEGFDVSYYPLMYRCQTHNFWYLIRNQLISSTLRQYQLKRFLEIGCGTGFVLGGIEKEHPDLQIYGADMHSQALNFCRRRTHSAQLFQMDARNIPFSDEFDAIGAFDVLEHIPEDAAVLQQIHKALRPGGVMLLTVPQYQYLWGNSDVWAKHVRRYEYDDLRSKVIAAGFKLQRMTSFFTFIFPLLLASKAYQHLNKRPYEPARELMVSPPLNNLLHFVSKGELALLQRNVYFPFGGSLFVVATKS